MDFQTFKQHFVNECRHLDIQHDTFARMLTKTGMGLPQPPPRLTERNRSVLHGRYLEALSQALQRNSRAKRGPLRA